MLTNIDTTLLSLFISLIIILGTQVGTSVYLKKSIGDLTARIDRQNERITRLENNLIDVMKKIKL